MRPNKKLLIGSVIFTVIFITLTVISTCYEKDQLSPEGRVLTAEFVKMYGTRKLFEDLSAGSLILSICGITGIAAAFRWNTVPTTKNDLTGPILLVLAIIFSALTFYTYKDEVFVLATKDPYVRTVTVADRYTTSHKQIKKHYLVMSNGVSIKVGSADYNYYKDGDEFYLIMCGNRCVGHFGADIYSLEDTEDGIQ